MKVTSVLTLASAAAVMAAPMPVPDGEVDARQNYGDYGKYGKYATYGTYNYNK